MVNRLNGILIFHFFLRESGTHDSGSLPRAYLCPQRNDGTVPDQLKRGIFALSIDRASGIFFVVLGLFVMWERRVLPLGTAAQPGPGYFPLLLAILLVLFGVILFFGGSRSASLRSLKWPEVGTAAAILGCCLFATLGMEMIGYRITMIIILGFLLGVVERLKLWQVFAFALFLAFGSFWLFDTFLKVPLPRGGLGF